LKYEPNKKSIKKHKVPDWYHDAKLGIFIHWGLPSIPAFAPTENEIGENLRKGGWKEHFKNNPYAEWYLNSLRIEGSPTQKYHFEKYGKDFEYDNFIPEYNKALEKWHPNEWAELFKKIGAKYVVFVTKHHDGFCHWYTKFQHPIKRKYCTSRDVVGELAKSVREKGMKFGVYYSGALDWSFNENPIVDFKSFINNGPMDPQYVEYVENQIRELIDCYKPSILWNDIGYPPGPNLWELFAEYYNKIKDGVVNDRWMQIGKEIRKIFNGPLGEEASLSAKKMFLEGTSVTPNVPHFDFRTPEYFSFNKIMKKKWESTRGIGKSFGYNRMETEKDLLSVDELIRMFIDIVSKNGNLLLNVGPKSDGIIPEMQIKRLLGLGKWLEINGEAIFNTRPWIKAEGKTKDGIEVRFTQTCENLYVIILDTPKDKTIIIKKLKIREASEIKLLGNEKNLTWNQNELDLKIYLSKKLLNAPAHTFKITPKPYM